MLEGTINETSHRNEADIVKIDMSNKQSNL